MKKNKMSKAKKIDAVVTYIVLIAACFVFFFPVLWLNFAKAHLL